MEAAEIAVKMILIFVKKGDMTPIKAFFTIAIALTFAQGFFTSVGFPNRYCPPAGNLTVAAAAICRKKTFSKC
ncbi:hypothetical protein LMZ02_24990 [Paenibacillus macerans]|uniref:hypothetical protein n=1 Tax=Paenibacillus macerans TaxID=44252 RepID=UPI000560DE0D|nr:hypothetical protein [Paenibacillus macerans]MBS5909519.1 hypothetical protein [Paenibacillus macerans]UMV46697.1 hypothetical protein LMZ02_24990 [Paenibacillus macerans]